MGELVRRAIDVSYAHKIKQNRGLEALKEINRINKGKPKLSDETILAWIREGRR